MRLVKFISTHTDAIVAAAVVYARTLPPLANQSDKTLADHIPKILQAIVHDLGQEQTDEEARAKSLGETDVDEGTPETAAQTHGRLRARNGLLTAQLVAEYRALRASVLRLWQDTEPGNVSVREVMRFNEAIDQAIAESVEFFSEEVDRLREIFLGVLGHDLRGPLNAMLLTTEVISHSPMDPALARHVGVLAQSGRRMATLLDTLLRYNRSALGQGLEIEPRDVDLARECAAEVEILRAALPEAALRFDAVGDASAHVDASAIREALGNLVNNAAKYGDGSPIAIALSCAGDTVSLAVTNAGVAIPAERIPRLFQPMQRGAEAEQDSGTSLGLGLYIVEQIAQAHGGSIDCTSVPGRTVFRLKLPRRVRTS